MPHVLSPDIQFIVNVLAIQDPCQAARSLRIFIVPAASQYVNMTAFPDLFQDGMVGQIGQVVAGTVEVDVFVKISLRILCEVIYSAHGKTSVDQVRPVKKQVGTVKGSEGCPAGDYRCFPAAVGADEGNYFLKHILVKLLVSDGFVSRVHLIVHPAFVVDAIDRKDLYPAGFDEWGNGIQQLKTFIFQVVGSSGGDEQKGKSIMPVNGHRHFLVQGRAMPGC
jgi:hypothetical protein